MKKLVHFYAVFLLLVHFRESHSYESGAPPDVVCSSMTPGHGGKSQSGDSPYIIKLSKTDVKGGETVQIILSSINEATNFKGFITMGQKMESLKSTSAGIPIGKFQFPTGGSLNAAVRHVKCGDFHDGAVTHTEGSGKKSVTFEWIAPNEDGDFVILASFVKDYNTYWVKQQSDVIHVKRNVAFVETKTTTTPAPKKQALSDESVKRLADFYDGCGKRKGCFGMPAGCVSQKDCNLFTTFRLEGLKYIFQLAGHLPVGGTDKGYVAVGLSFDDKMNEDSVIGCYADGTTVTPHSYYTIGRELPIIIQPPRDDGLVKGTSNGTVIDGIIFCEFGRTGSLEIKEIGKTFNLTEDKYQILLARGQGSSNVSLVYHGENKIASPYAISLSDTQIVGEELLERVYENCGMTKGCFSVPEHCHLTKNCEMFLSFNNQLEFEIIGNWSGATNNGHVSVGLSFDKLMGQDSVTGCVLQQNGAVVVKSYYNVEALNTKQNYIMKNETAGLISRYGKYIDGVLYCQFTRTDLLEPSQELQRPFNLLTDEYYLFLARANNVTRDETGREQLGVHVNADDLKISPRIVKLTDHRVVLPPFDKDEAERTRERFYSGCADSKGCFGLPEGCIPKGNCGMFISFNKNLQFQITGQVPGNGSQGHISVGLSFDNKMGEDSVIGCVLKGGAVRPMSYYTYNVAPVGKNNFKMTDETAGLASVEDEKGRYIDGMIFCEFTRTPQLKISEPGNDRTFDLNSDEYYIMMARAFDAPEEKLGYHVSLDDKVISDAAYPLSYIGILGAKSNILIELHAGLMIIAWLMCASTGMFTARYYKQTHTDFNPLNKAFWFVLHISCMFTTVFLTICGGIIIFVEVGGYSSDLEGAASWHPILGLILVGLALMQILIAFFRPHPGTPKRPLFNWIHWSIGNTAHIVGIACIFLAKELNKSGLSKEGKYLYVVTGFVIFHVVMHIVMAIHTVWADKQMDTEIKMRSVRPGPMKPSGKSDEAPGTGFRTGLLALYLIGCAAVAITLIVLVVNGL